MRFHHYCFSRTPCLYTGGASASFSTALQPVATAGEYTRRDEVNQLIEVRCGGGCQDGAVSLVSHGCWTERLVPASSSSPLCHFKTLVNFAQATHPLEARSAFISTSYITCTRRRSLAVATCCIRSNFHSSNSRKHSHVACVHEHNGHLFVMEYASIS